jgi:hypothetical protein
VVYSSYPGVNTSPYVSYSYPSYGPTYGTPVYGGYSGYSSYPVYPGNTYGYSQPMGYSSYNDGYYGNNSGGSRRLGGRLGLFSRR